jgi:hypothetical protein
VPSGPERAGVPFKSRAYGEEVAAILAMDGSGERLMPLAMGKCSSDEARRLIARRSARKLFPQARAPEAALSGLYLYFSCLDEVHETAQAIETPDGNYWHGILHRQEPDAGNASYWFRRVGRHAIFPELCRAAHEIAQRYPQLGVRIADPWDPSAFIDLCELARRSPGSELEKMAQEIQRAEWQLLFHYCASPPSA